MSESAQAGSGAAGTQQTGTPGSQQTPAVNGSATGAETPFSGLSEGTRKWAETKGYKSYEDIALQGMNAEQKMGSMISVPSADAKPEEWQGFYSKLPEAMRPVSDIKFDYKRPEGLPADLPYSDDLANASKQWAVEAGVPAKAAQVFHDGFAKWQAEQWQAQKDAVGKSVDAAHDELVKTWGPKDGEAFKIGVEKVNRTLKKLGILDSAKKLGFLLPDGALTDGQFAKAMAVAGDALGVLEDTIDHGSVPAGTNPWKTGNITQQSLLKKNDPATARRLVKEAGLDPANYGLQ